MARAFILAGAVFGALATLLGAFGSHGLEGRIDDHRLAVFEIGVRYQFHHALGLLAVGLLARTAADRLLAWAGGLFVFGILAFSFSLYLLALTGTHWAGPITPVGGTALFAGWVLIAVHAWRRAG